MEKEFDEMTMTRATQSDITRMWKRLWGSVTVIRYLTAKSEDGEILDLLQLEALVELESK